MKIAVIGLGSMGKRRIRLLKMLEQHDLVGVDEDAARRNETMESLGIPVFSTLDELLSRWAPEAAVVSTPPLTHAAIIATLLEHDVHVFTEINLVSDRYPELIALAGARERVLFLSSTMLYRDEVRYLERQGPYVGCDYTYHVGQYLPDWHPWEDYRHFFVSRKRSHAIRELMTIELPWLVALFGPVNAYKVSWNRASRLDLPCPDTCLLLLEHDGDNKGALVFDVVSRRAVRDFRLFDERHFIEWNGCPDGLRELNLDEKSLNPVRFDNTVIKDPRYADNIIENDYLAELRAFFDKIARPREARYYNFEDDLAILALIDRLESEQ